MKKSVRQNISFKEFLTELKINQTRYYFFVALFFFLLLLPGQSYYQTLFWTPLKPLYQNLPFAISPPAPYAEKNTQEPAPFLSAQAAILMDVDSQVVLYSKNPHQKLLPASTTKIMTAIVALEKYQPETILTGWESYSESTSDAALMGVVNGDRVTFKNMLYGLLLNSGADAAETIARNYPGGKSAFITEMNNKAKLLHLNDSHFVNEAGLDDRRQVVSVLDLARLATYALKNPLFAKVVATPEIFVTDVTLQKRYYLKNINKLLGAVWGVDGIKTGYTQQAGECLVVTVSRGGHRLLSVVLKSNDRFAESQQLLEWGYRNHVWKNY